MKHEVEIPRIEQTIDIDGCYIKIDPELERMIREIHEKLCGDKK